MNVVGFDVGKDSLFGARIDASMRVKERFALPNTKEAIEPVLADLRKRHKRLLIASESTAEYHRPLAELCVELGIPFHLLNPITTKQLVRTTVRKKKTDVTDAEAIALVAAQGGGTVVTKASFRDAQPITRTAVKLIQLGQMLNLMQQHLTYILPNETALTGELQACHERLIDASDVFATRDTPDKLRELLQSIPGIGPVTATTLIAEIGDIANFKDAKALVAYAGLDCRVRQSGKTLQRNTRLTKRGSPYLRRALYMAAASAARSDEELKRAFDKKRGEGKRYKEATIVVARKLTARVYAVWKRSTPYKQKIA